MRQYIYQSIIYDTLKSPMQCLEVVNPLNSSYFTLSAMVLFSANNNIR